MLSSLSMHAEIDDKNIYRRTVDSKGLLQSGGRSSHSHEKSQPAQQQHSRSNQQPQHKSRLRCPKYEHAMEPSYKENCKFCVYGSCHFSLVSIIPSMRIRRTYHCVLQTLIGIVVMIALLHNLHMGNYRYYNSEFRDSLDSASSFKYRALRIPDVRKPTIQNETDSFPNIVWWNGEDSIQQQQIIDNNNQHNQIKGIQRKQRCRPPMNQSSLLPVFTSPKSTKRVQAIYIPLTNQTHNEWNWTELCEKANLNKNSRVLITNSIVTSNIGPALSLLISKQCQVKSMTNIDPMLPNIHSLRIYAMSLYRRLYRSIPNFKLIVPMASAGLTTIPDQTKHPTESRATLLWLEHLSPTYHSFGSYDCY